MPEWTGYMAQYRKRNEKKWTLKFCENLGEAEGFVLKMRDLGYDAACWSLLHGC
jgi:hypothetical protein